MSLVANNIVQLIWILMIISALISVILPALRECTLHGKLLKSSKPLHVPKHWFKYFYVVGTIWNLACLTTLLFYYKLSSTAVWCSILFQIHVTRRLYESYYITSFKSSQMHLLAFLVGVFYYTLLPVSIIVGETQGGVLSAGVVLFIFANVEQYRINNVFSKLKSTRSCYQIPFDHYSFTYISASPHYSFEILIYTSLYMIHPTTIMLLILLWVIITHVISATESYKWYCQTFKEEFTTLKRNVILPFVY